MTTEMKEIKKDSSLYPASFKMLESAPGTLYVRGELPDEQKPVVAVVGARICSSYGMYMARIIAHVLAEEGVQVLNGMGLGIDGIALRSALSAGKKAYAVLGTGVDFCYPDENRDLYHSLIASGGVISMFKPGTGPKPEQFVARNDLIAAFADIVIVVEARAKSATFDLVKKAQALGKMVYAVPGRVTDRLSDGPRKLIREGANVFFSTEEVLEDLCKKHMAA